jgi:hypothetical protein
MAMKKTSGGDSPLQQGAGESFWTLRSRVDDGGGSRCVLGKLIGPLGFSRRGDFIGEGASSGVDQGALTIGGCGPLVVRLAPGPSPCHLRSSRSFSKNRRFGFCFVQFRKYFLCNSSETQKQ